MSLDADKSTSNDAAHCTGTEQYRLGLPPAPSVLDTAYNGLSELLKATVTYKG
jgi:hypothetical protein